MNYLDKYKSNYQSTGRRTIHDILSLNADTDWETIEENYVATDIHKIKIGGNTFTNYGDFQFAWEKSYVKSPERSADGSIGNLNAYTSFVVPHLIINFSVMSIDDYRKICMLDLEQNEFVVECYDPIYNRKFKGKMYFATPQMAKLFKIAKVRFDGERWEEYVELLGVQEYTVEMIGTNADVDSISVIYHLNPPSDVLKSDFSISSNELYSGEDVIIGDVASSITSETFYGLYKFTKWNVSAENPTTPKDVGNYLNGYAYTINSGDEIVADGQSAFHLYAQWQSTQLHTLSYNYGVAEPTIDDEQMQYVTSIQVSKGQSIGNLPIILRYPKVKYTDPISGEQKETSPYYQYAWYKTPTKAENSVPLTDGAPYWLDRDGSIYLIFDVFRYNLRLFIDGVLSVGVSVGYNEQFVVPEFVMTNKVLDGWYTTPDFQQGTKYSGRTMPPCDLTLYARWVNK